MSQLHPDLHRCIKTPSRRSIYLIRVPHQISEKRISDEVSVYTGEILVLLLAVQEVEETRASRMIICSDSNSALNSLQHRCSDSRRDILIETQQTLGSYTGIFMGTSTCWQRKDRIAKEKNNIDLNINIK